MRLPSRIAPLLVGLMLAACSGIEVNTNYDPSAVQQLESYRTYAWLPTPEGKDPRVYNDLINNNLHQAVDRVLQGRGYRQVAMDASPDFVIGWQGAIDSKLDAQTVNSYYGYGWGTMWSPYYGGGVGVPYTYVREYEEGTLILDIVDAKAKQLVWRGTAQAVVDENPTAQSSRERINEAVEEMLERFPPQPEQ
ncbi:DUF4136 domain-containing protein [Pyxidicoccus fallax]|uniref:DUF4136 domain-containing protein n=1 Tax=Pyxidicoccus fallax TaxID=394095 RepID=A0A848L393_9BACT|nr:DUF4136 domain-containing protein [Pyxidicoccus fallax]NMO13390.1 DUF4136 domain-containing protein [Pyxidicoccus fallax]NPC80299.1 DUF4136 domain-containing protein [Pyxidicoccus fallax]